MVEDNISFDPYGLTSLSEEQINLIEQVINESELEWDDAILLAVSYTHLTLPTIYSV